MIKCEQGIPTAETADEYYGSDNALRTMTSSGIQFVAQFTGVQIRKEDLRICALIELARQCIKPGTEGIWPCFKCGKQAKWQAP